MPQEPDAVRLEARIPQDVRDLTAVLRAAGHDAFVVGGSIRDVMLGHEPLDWDLTTDAEPERLRALFPGARYENRFGTVVVTRGGVEYEITTYRTERDYDDHRRPTNVAFGATLAEDLARRDFTVNAMAFGWTAADPEGAPAHLADPHGGRADLEGCLLRAVGDPDARFGEDALRMLRAVRLEAMLGFAIEPPTLAAVGRHAAEAAHLAGPRIGAELLLLLDAVAPGPGLRRLQETGLLDATIPELAAQRGIPQAKIPGDDLWDHTVRTVAAAPPTPVARVAALFHDVGKPTTFADGRFHRHDFVGAGIADAILERLAVSRDLRERVVRLVRHHMFSYETTWSDAAVRRFIQRTGADLLDDLFDLRASDDAGSGVPADGPRISDLRRRCREQLDANVPLRREDLAIDGDDVMEALGIAPGPRLGRILDRITERVVDDPALNDRGRLLALARAIDRNLEDR
jgi:tRNA nucleotidyltransferase (CCA-adding enzyme)